ncbi:MAG: hypothetical protein EHM42_11270 [Planctomycetaceae bacterium]|nr:MAG: hypothetical protein EHM42_11270 [Planctomycetaceae bacterium]
MESHYTLAGQSQHVIVLGVPGEDVYDFHKLCYDVYDFIPNGSESATPAAIPPLAESPERTLRR